MKVIKFEKQGCPPCQAVGIFLKNNNIPHEVVDVFDDPATAQQYGVTFSTPVVVVVNDQNEVVFRTVGYKPEDLEKIVEMMKE